MKLLPPGPAAPAPLRWLGNIVDTVIVALGAALVVVVFSNVVLHAFDQDIAWTTEFGEHRRSSRRTTGTITSSLPRAITSSISSTVS